MALTRSSRSKSGRRLRVKPEDRSFITALFLLFLASSILIVASLSFATADVLLFIA